MDKNEKCTFRACKAIVFCPINMQICDVLVHVAVVVAEAPQSLISSRCLGTDISKKVRLNDPT